MAEKSQIYIGLQHDYVYGVSRPFVIRVPKLVITSVIHEGR